jgi:hypothetical protein
MSIKICNEGPRIAFFTHEEDRTGDDVTNEGKQNEKWVKNSASPIPTFNPQ